MLGLAPVIFEDIAHKYALRDMGQYGRQLNVNTCLVKLLPEGEEVLIGYFRDETIARNTALSLEFYKSKNRMIDGVLQNE